MNYSEYLRRKLESLPVVYGPSRYGDESTRIMAARYKASVRRPGQATDPKCCTGPTPYWRSGGGRPDAGPFRRAGDGQQQVWSSEFVAASAAGCAVCTAGKAGYIYKECCPPEPTPEAPLNPATKALALRGKETCCPVVGPTLQSLPPDCSCAVRPTRVVFPPECSCEEGETECYCIIPGRQNTLAANDMPSKLIPYPARETSCTRCGILIPVCECEPC
jgi:hypothetical protein